MSNFIQQGGFGERYVANPVNQNTRSEKVVNSTKGISELIMLNEPCNTMLYIKTKNKLTETEIHEYHDLFLANGSNRQKTQGFIRTCATACDGTFKIVEYGHRLHMGEKSDTNNLYVTLEVRPPSETVLKLTMLWNDFTAPSTLQRELQNKGIYIEVKHIKTWYRSAFLVLKDIFPTDKYIGWWHDENCRLFNAEDEEFRKGYDSNYNSARLSKDIGIVHGNTTNCQAILAASVILVADTKDILKCYGISNLSGVVMHFNDEPKAADKLNRALSPDKNRVNSGDGDESTGRCTVFRIDKLSEYMRRKRLTQAGESLDDFEIYITGKNFYDLSDELTDRFLCIECSDLMLKEYNPLRCWFVVKALDNVDFMTELMSDIAHYKKQFNDYAKSPVAYTAALLMAISKAYLSLLPESWYQQLLDELDAYMLDLLDGNIDDLSNSFVTYLTTLRDFPVVTKDEYDKNKEQLLVSGDNLFLSRMTMQHIALKLNTTTKVLCDNLKSNGLLIADHGAQKAAKIKGKTPRLYTLNRSDIVPDGDIAFEHNDFNGTMPKLMLKLGTNYLTDVYFASEFMDGSKNCHVMITGNTRTGKSTFLTNVARQAVASGIRVVSIGTIENKLSIAGSEIKEYIYSQELIDESHDFPLSEVLSGVDRSFLDEEESTWSLLLEQSKAHDKRYSSAEQCIGDIIAMIDASECTMLIKQLNNILEEKFRVFSWEDVLSSKVISTVEVVDDYTIDMVLAKFYDYMVKHNDGKPCMLILDECQDLSMDAKSPLMKVMRQGAKHGIMAFLSTQYLNSQNGSDACRIQELCGTKVVFRPVRPMDMMKQLGYDSSDTELKELLSTLDRGECVVKGSICTNKCMIDYPVKVIVPGQI